MGLLTELPTKNQDTIVPAMQGTSEQQLQEFLTNMQWDEENLNRQRVQKLIAEATLDYGMLVPDDTGRLSQKRQDLGRGGAAVLRDPRKVGNCWIATNCWYTDLQPT